MASTNPNVNLSAAQEAAFERKAEKHFRSHRELPNGKNFRCWNRDADPEADKKYRDNYDATFRGGKPSS
jgi:hypothetical protein